jgi:predicted O-methyltransferase YrrM
MVADFPNWFAQTAQPNFERFLIPLAGQDYLQFLQLGAYTGDASVWMLDFVLQGEGSRLTDVDTWQGSDEEAHESINFEDVYNNYLHKLDEYEYQVSIKRMTTFDYLITHRSEQFDFIYVDADHTSAGALLDAELSWGLLKSGGIMAFDDYTWGDHLPAYLAPKLGINLFLHRHQGKYELLVMNTQVWIKKL